MESIIQLLIVLISAIWLLLMLRASRFGARVQDLRDVDYVELETWPLVSIIVTARDEAHTIGAALQKLLANNYPRVEFILVNDRSTDGTREVIEEQARLDSRIHPIHVKLLPAGWLGKVHALQQGVDRATGEFMLFTDADIHFEQDVLRRAVSRVQTQHLDHLALIPESIPPQSVWLTILETAFGSMFVQTARSWKLADPQAADYIGVGAFNLVRRSTYDRTLGFEYLRMEVLDDIGVGLMIKQASGRSALMFARRLLGFSWYPTLPAMIAGLEKNSFAGFGHYRYGRTILLITAMLLLSLGPVMMAIAILNPLLLVMVVFIYSLLPALIGSRLKSELNISPVVLGGLPIGFAILAFVIARSMYATWRRGGISWRGTVYALDDLRALQRVKLSPLG